MDVGYMTRRIIGDLKTVEPSKCAVKLESELSWTCHRLFSVSLYDL
jgi:hypothetical protein